MKKIIIYGGCGFLGTYVVKELLGKNYFVIVFDKIKKKIKK